MDVLSLYKSQIQDFPDFTREPQLIAELVKRMKARDEIAKDALIKSTLMYVLKIATFHCKKENSWAELIDLVQEANFRVSGRIAKFDPKKGSLKAFVWMCTNTAFYDYMSRNGTVISTRYARQMAKSIDHARSRLREQLSREPTDKELSEDLGISEVRLRKLTVSVVRGFVSLDGPATAGEDAQSVGDTLVGKTVMDEDLLSAIQVKELHKIAVGLFGKSDADLWKTYKEGNTKEFYDHYFRRTGKSEVAARQFISRRTKKLIAHIQKKTKRSTLGGNHEFTAACSG
jgi:DNA-directed RNA polymerase specialized sigma subunit